MLRGVLGCLRMKPGRSRVRIIWWTEGGVTPKYPCISFSAGGRQCTQRVGVYEGQILALLGCKFLDSFPASHVD